MAAEVLEKPVGLRMKLSQVANLSGDQEAIVRLLAGIPMESGGRPGLSSGPRGQCPKELGLAIWDFQTRWLGKGIKKRDGVVDPGGSTLAQLNLLSTGAAPLIGPGGTDPTARAIEVSLESVNGQYGVVITNPVVANLSEPVLREVPLALPVSLYRCKVRKNGRSFWIGAAVPVGTLDYTGVQLYFHPTPTNGGVVHAADPDYASFGGGWAGSIERYLPMIGGQLAGVRPMVLLTPFMTMAAMSDGAANMFTEQGVEMLNAVMAALQRESNWTMNAPDLQQIGVTSFSSGIEYLRRFISAVGPSGLIREVIELDASFNHRYPAAPTLCEGAVSKAYGQRELRSPPPGWTTLAPHRWKKVKSFAAKGTHAQIGWMTYFAAMQSSVIT
ncbi:hypothetical protein PGB34_05125 [Xenophilus arseniciresistens]|uniref:Uncharacterized protein n=1 Tax=Xenophilus arseniciresistens TaxID=1283306 RepID=A0AAE3N9L8_9BURK|nr:hypothetical protein [Xenophilus arseniciresistens]MDA7415739.1 hypothetical protein [Xenophilus arseniciresistens]